MGLDVSRAANRHALSVWHAHPHPPSLSRALMPRPPIFLPSYPIQGKKKTLFLGLPTPFILPTNLKCVMYTAIVEFWAFSCCCCRHGPVKSAVFGEGWGVPFHLVAPGYCLTPLHMNTTWTQPEVLGGGGYLCGPREGPMRHQAIDSHCHGGPSGAWGGHLVVSPLNLKGPVLCEIPFTNVFW